MVIIISVYIQFELQKVKGIRLAHNLTLIMQLLILQQSCDLLVLEVDVS